MKIISKSHSQFNSKNTPAAVPLILNQGRLSLEYPFMSCLNALLPAFFTLMGVVGGSTFVNATEELPIADAHVHYSHDSVEFTPPERVIELMRNAGLKFALVSSSDDNGTQLLSDLAPELIVPGLRPYRKRGELQTWFTDAGALAYVEDLLAKNRYATIGEFHLYGEDANLEIPRRIVELADQYNLILHAHSDSEAVALLLQQSETVKVLWAHSGFDSPAKIADMLRKHDRLWADLAFRSDVGSGGKLSPEWQALFEEFPERMMLGTDTYTPERIYFIPEHADRSRNWLQTLPLAIAEQVAWKNAWNLLMPHWQKNRTQQHPVDGRAAEGGDCSKLLQNTELSPNTEPDTSLTHWMFEKNGLTAMLKTALPISVSEPFSAKLVLCGSDAVTFDTAPDVSLAATMPAHGHGMNYQPSVTLKNSESKRADYLIEGLLMHMPGQWQWRLQVQLDAGQSGQRVTLEQSAKVQ